MKISIITATYNSARTVRDTLESIATQDYPDIEHIIVDGLSKDESLSIVSEYPHVAKVISEKDRGIYDAMNKGIGLATGEIVGILNSDDFYNHNSVLSKVAKLFEDPEVEAVYGDLQYVSHRDVSKITRTWKAGPCSANKFLYGWMPPHPSFFVRKRVYEKVGLFNLNLRSAVNYDLMLLFVFCHKFKPAYLHIVSLKMREGGMSNTSLKNRISANREDWIAWKLSGIKPYFFTLYLKPLRKVIQFITK